MSHSMMAPNVSTNSSHFYPVVCRPANGFIKLCQMKLIILLRSRASKAVCHFGRNSRLTSMREQTRVKGDLNLICFIKRLKLDQMYYNYVHLLIIYLLQDSAILCKIFHIHFIINIFLYYICLLKNFQNVGLPKF